MWWQWLLFAIIIIITPFSIGYIGARIKRKAELTNEQDIVLKKNVIRYIVFCYLIDLFYMSFIIDNITFKFIFGGLLLLIILYNLAISFITNMKKEKWQRIGLLFDFVVGLILTIYLIYIIPGKQVEVNEIITVDYSLRDIIAMIAAAVLGGLFTLVGVAWTIRKADKDRKNDLFRLEKEKREENRRMYSPVFCVRTYVEDGRNTIKIALDELEDINKIASEDKRNYSIRLQGPFLENSSKIEFYTYGFMFDDIFLSFPEKKLIKKNCLYYFYFYNSYRLKRNFDISICIEDLIENKYTVKLNTVLNNETITVRGISQLKIIGEKNE